MIFDSFIFRKTEEGYGYYRNLIKGKNWSIKLIVIERGSVDLFNPKHARLWLFIKGKGKVYDYTPRRTKEKYIGPGDFLLANVGDKHEYQAEKKTKVIEVTFGRDVIEIQR